MLHDDTIYFVTGNAGKLREVTAALQAGSDDIKLASVKLDLDELQEDRAELISQRKALEAFRLVNKVKADATAVVAATATDPASASFELCFYVDEPADAEPTLFKRVLVDDSSLSFAALGDLPGPYIKFFLQGLGNEGLVKMVEGFADSRDSAAQAALAASEVDAETVFLPPTHRLATASSIFTLAYAVPAGAAEELSQEGGVVRKRRHYRVVTAQFVGNAPGCLVGAPRGTNGFGWDAIFAPAVTQENYAANKEALSQYSRCVAAAVCKAAAKGHSCNSSFPPATADHGFSPDKHSYKRTYAEMSDAEKNLVSHRAAALEKLKSLLPSIVAGAP